MCCSETGPIFWAAPAVWLYGAPYVAVPLVPSSSVTAVATKSLGAAFDHDCRVMALSSGEPKIDGQCDGQHGDHDDGDDAFLDDVVLTPRAGPRPRVPLLLLSARLPTHDGTWLLLSTGDS